MNNERIVILGVGNILLKDEGIGFALSRSSSGATMCLKILR